TFGVGGGLVWGALAGAAGPPGAGQRVEAPRAAGADEPGEDVQRIGVDRLHGGRTEVFGRPQPEIDCAFGGAEHVAEMLVDDGADLDDGVAAGGGGVRAAGGPSRLAAYVAPSAEGRLAGPPPC